MNWKFLDVATVQSLHTQQIQRFGGSPGLRDPGLLESAVVRAENKANYDPLATVATIAASLSWGLIKNHAFIDGNKRIGLASLVVFLKLNGYEVIAPAAEQVTMVLSVASTEITEDAWAAWVEKSIRPTT